MFDNAPDAEFRIAFDPEDGAWSYVGTDCRGIPLNEPTMNLGFLDDGTAGHEFGHAIGLAHEHQSPAGGIQWNEDVVIREAAKSPNFWDEETTRHNILRKYGADQINGTAFDPDSIMLYFFPASWTLNGVGTHANEVLSALDKQFIAGAKMYPQTGGTVSEATELAGGRGAAHLGRHRQGRRGGPVPLHGGDGRPLPDRHPRPDRRRHEAVRPEQRDGADRGRRRLGRRLQRAHRRRPDRRRLLRAGAALQPRDGHGQLHDQGAQGVRDFLRTQR